MPLLTSAPTPTARSTTVWRQTAAVAVLYLAVAVVMTWPMVRQPWALAGPPEDNLMFGWQVWYGGRVLAGQASPGHTDLLFYPQGVSLVWHTMSHANVLLAQAFRGFGIAAAHNAVLLLGFVIAGVGMYWLARRLYDDWRAALVAGLVFAFSSFHLLKAQHHLNLASVHCLPLFALFLLRTLATARWRDALALSACFLLTFYSELTYALFLAVFAGLALVERWECRALAPRRQLLPRLAVSAGLGVLGSLPLLVPMLREGAPPDTGSAAKNSLDLLGCFWPNAPLRELLRLPALHFTGFPWETSAYLGLTALVLAGLSWGLRLPERRLWVATGLVFAVVALGPSVKVAGFETFIPGPYAVVSHVPLLSVMRTPARAVVMTGLALAVLAGAGCAWLARRWPRRAGLLAVVLGAAFLAEAWVGPFPMTDVTPHAFYRELAAMPDDFAVLTLPAERYTDQEWHTYMQIYHGKPILVGNVARLPPATTAFWRALDFAPATLARHRIKYVIIDRRRQRERAATDPFAGSALPLVVDDDVLRVYRVYP